MRTALISDIHGHLHGLLSVLADVEESRCDRVICLGDLVEGGSEDQEVVETLQRLEIQCVRGNHDHSNDLKLPEEIQNVLSELPDTLVEDDILYCHISPREKLQRIRHTIEAWNVFDETSQRLIFTGHQHVPMIFGEKSQNFGEATQHSFEHNQPFPLHPEDRYIICVGSASYGRDHLGLLRYAIYDSKAQTVEHRSVKGQPLSKDYSVRFGSRSS